MIQVNMTSLTHLTKLFLNKMLENKSGWILNVASSLGFLPVPLFPVYSASKAYVLHLTEALACELQGTGVSVTCLCPPPTKTSFWVNMENSKSSKGQMMDAAKVAQAGYTALKKGKIYQVDETTSARAGILEVNGKKLETPILWLGQQINGIPNPWEHFDVDAILVNAYEILNSNGKTLETVNKKGIHKYLNFKGSVMMDSGGFLFQKKDQLNVDPIDIVDLYHSSKLDFGVVLDHPLNPTESNYLNNKRWKNTIKNTNFMFKNNGELAIMPVTHGYTKRKLKKACDEIKDIMNEPDAIAIGSLVPLIKSGWIGNNQKGNGRKFVIDAIKLVRQEFSDSFMHVFGVGGTTTMHLMYSLGVDSIDSIGWRIAAAHRQIQLPGVGVRVLSPVSTRVIISKKEKEILARCECPTCKDLNIKNRIKVLDNSFEKRALHNAWVYGTENKKFKNHIIFDITLGGKIL